MEIIRSFILGVMAILPAIFLVYLIYKKDSIEKEPIRLIGFVGLLGALTVLGAGLLEYVAISMLHISNPTLSHFIECFFIIALVEEGGKLFVTYISVWKHPEFNYRFDGIVYAVSASAGFAIVENLFYIFQNENSFSVAILRAITAIPGHIVFGIVMGLFIGMAKYYKGLGDNTMKSFCLVLALIGPMVVHGLYDFIVFGLEENEGNVLLLFGYIIFQDIIGILILFNSAKKDVPISGMMPQMQGIMPNGMYQQMQNGMLQDRRENLNQKRIVYGTDFFEDEKTVCLSSSDKLNQKVAYEKTVFPNEPVQKENMVSMNFPSQMPGNETVALNKNDFGQFEGTVALGVNDLELNEGTMDSLNVSEEDVTMDLSSTF